MSVDNMNLIFQAIGLLFVMLGGLWKIWDSLKNDADKKHKSIQDSITLIAEDNTKRINRIYERMDARQEEYHKEFVRVDVHNLTINHLEQKTDEKFNQTIMMWKLELAQLTKAIDKLVKNEEERYKNNKD